MMYLPKAIKAMALLFMSSGLALMGLTSMVGVHAVEEPALFSDIRESDELYSAASYLKERGVVEGYSDGELKPKQNINRAEFVKIILEAKKDVDIYFDAAYSFPDLDKDVWYAKYVSTAKREGIVQGYPDGTFKPSQTIIYPEAIKVIIETFDVDKSSSAMAGPLKEFSDQWYAPYMNTAYYANIYRPSYGFQPGTYIDRGDSFESLYRTMVIRDRGLPSFSAPGLQFGSQYGVVNSAFQSPFALSVSHRGISEPLSVSVYKVPNIETYFKSRAGKNDSYYGWYGQDDSFAASLLDEMEKVDQSNIAIETMNKEFNDYYYPGSYEQGMLKLPISAPGLYAMVVEYPELPPKRLFVIASNASLLVRESDENFLAWMVDGKTSTPLSGATLNWYQVTHTKDGLIDELFGGKTTISKKGSGTTDADGVFTGSKGEANYFYGEKDGHPVLLTADMDEWENSEEDNISAFGYSDRPVYRPGDEVNYKVIIRQGRNGTYTLPSNNQATVEIYNYLQGQENKLYEKELSINEFGTVNGTLKLTDSVATGEVYLKVTLGEGSYATGLFLIEEYKKDEYYVEAESNKAWYVTGDDVRVDVSAQYFFGEPVANQKVTYKVYRSGGYNYPYYDDYMYEDGMAAREDMAIAPYRYYGGREEVMRGTGSFDANGKYTFLFTPGEDDEEEDYYSEPIFGERYYTVEFSTIDDSNIEVKGSSSFTVHGAEFTIGAKNMDRFPKVGEQHQVEVTVLDHDKKPRSGVTITAELERTVYERIQDGEYYDWWVGAYVPQYRWNNYSEDVVTMDITTNSSGKATFTYTPDLAASYSLKLSTKDPRGNKVETSQWFSARGGDSKYFSGRWGYNYVDIQTDKENYNEGERATISIDAGVEKGHMLIMDTQNDIFDYDVVSYDNYGYEYSELLNTHAPAYTVLVETIDKGNFYSGQKRIEVRPVTKELQISVVPSKNQALPEDEVTFTVTVKDRNGVPQQGEFSLALVDKAIFELADPTWDNIFDYFYTSQYFDYIRRYTSFKQQLDTATDEEEDGYAMSEATTGAVANMAEPAPSPAMDDTEMAREEKSMDPGLGGNPSIGESVARSEFMDTAHFVGTVKTNALGKGEVTIKLPHNLTTWVAIAIGLTKDTKLGIGEGEVITKKDVIVSPFIPRFVTMKDTVVVRAAVRNYRSANGTFSVSLNAKGATLLSPQTQEIGIAAGESRTVSWEIEAMTPETYANFDTGMELTMKAQLKGTAIQDTVIHTIPMNLIGDEQIISHSGEGTTSISLSPKSGKVGNIRSVTVDVTPTLADNMVRSIEYLTGYPYGCVEQTMSRFLPNVIVYGARNTLKFQNQAIFTDMDEKVETGLQRLYDYQHSDGGWGWWKDDATTLKNSAYVMYGLTMAKKAGFEVNETVFANGLRFLTTTTPKLADGTYQHPERDWYGNDYNAKKYLPYYFYVLALNGKDYSSSVASLDVKTLQAADVAYLALGYKALGNSAKATALLPELRSRVTTSGDRSFVKEEVADYERMSSRHLSTALVLETFAVLDSSDPLVEKMIRWLDASRQGYVYQETHATSHAIIALVAYMKQVGAGTNQTTYEVKLGSQVLSSGSLTSMKTIDIDTSKLTGNDTLTITKSGGGKLYYTVVQREFIDSDTLPAVNNGISVERSYKDKFGRTASGTVKAGDILRVDIQVDASDDYHYVMIKDSLPAGFEPVNTNLNKDASFNQDTYQGEWTSHRDLRDDHTAMFVTRMSEGDHSYTYYIRAVTPGDYIVNPTRVELMYAPDINGSTATSRITVE